MTPPAPLSEAKRAAWEKGEPFPIEIGDFIWWKHSYKVAGTVEAEGFMPFGKQQIPCWQIYNPLFNKKQLVPKDSAVLGGWG
jgi:hypothetical protein